MLIVALTVGRDTVATIAEYWPSMSPDMYKARTVRFGSGLKRALGFTGWWALNAASNVVNRRTLLEERPLQLIQTFSH